MQDPLDRKISRGFGLAIVVLSAILIISLWLNARKRDRNLAVTHTHEVLINIEHLRLGMSRSETQFRGYLLTGEPEYLEAYWTASTDTQRYILRLKELISGNTAQQRNLEHVDALLEHMDTTRDVALRRYPQTELLRQSELSPKDQATSESMERLLMALEREETDLLHQRIDQLRREALASGLISTLLSISLFSLLGVLYKTTRNDMGLRRVNATLLQEATTDALTELKNRRAFETNFHMEYQRAIRYGRPLSCLLVDVDLFKRFNDTYGHPAGDQALRQVAALLQENARVSDCTARYGGEEFAILLPETDTEGALEVAERLRLAIEEHTWSLLPLTVSIGVSSLQAEWDSATALMQRADQALYAAKAGGRNRVELIAPLPTFTSALVDTCVREHARRTS